MVVNCTVQRLTLKLMRGSQWMCLYSPYGICGWLSDAVVAQMSVNLAL